MISGQQRRDAGATRRPDREGRAAQYPDCEGRA